MNPIHQRWPAVTALDLDQDTGPFAFLGPFSRDAADWLQRHGLAPFRSGFVPEVPPAVQRVTVTLRQPARVTLKLIQTGRAGGGASSTDSNACVPAVHLVIEEEAVIGAQSLRYDYWLHADSGALLRRQASILRTGSASSYPALGTTNLMATSLSLPAATLCRDPSASPQTVPAAPRARR